MKATALLHEQHCSLHQQLVHLGRLGESRPERTLQLVEELMTHLVLEDRLFLGSMATTTGIDVKLERDLQASVRNAVLQAVFAEGDDEAFLCRIRELSRTFDRHAHSIDNSVSPAVELSVDARRLEAMGRAMAAQWAASVSSSSCRNAARHERAAE